MIIWGARHLKEKTAATRTTTTQRHFLWPTFIFPITCHIGRAQFPEICPGVSSFRKKELIKGAGKRIHSSTICLLSCNIHSLFALGLRRHTNSQIFRLCGHWTLLLWSTGAFDIESNLCVCAFSWQVCCQCISSISLQNSEGKAMGYHQQLHFCPRDGLYIQYLLLPNPCLRCHISSS